MSLTSTFSQESLLDEGCSTSRNNISRSLSISSLGGIERRLSFTAQGDIDWDPTFYDVIKPVLEGKEPSEYLSKIQQEYIGPQEPTNTQPEYDATDGVAARASADRSSEVPSTRIPFLYRPPGSVSSLGRFDSVSSLNTEGSFYQLGRLDNLPEAEEPEDIGDPTQYEWQHWQGSNNTPLEDDPDDDSTVSPAMSATVTPSASRAQSPSSFSAFDDYGSESCGSGYDTESSGCDYDSREATPTRRQRSPSSASACGGYYHASQSGYDTEPDDGSSGWNHSIRSDITSTWQATMPSSPYRSISTYGRASSEPAPVTTPSRYNTRSGQTPGSYVAKISTSRRRRAGGESISASPYARKQKKGP